MHAASLRRTVSKDGLRARVPQSPSGRRRRGCWMIQWPLLFYPIIERFRPRSRTFSNRVMTRADSAACAWYDSSVTANWNAVSHRYSGRAHSQSYNLCEVRMRGQQGPLQDVQVNRLVFGQVRYVRKAEVDEHLRIRVRDGRRTGCIDPDTSSPSSRTRMLELVRSPWTTLLLCISATATPSFSASLIRASVPSAGAKANVNAFVEDGTGRGGYLAAN